MDMERASVATKARTPTHGRAAGERPATGHIDLVCEGGGVRGIAPDGTIAVPTLGVHTTDFGLSPTQAQALYHAGREAASAFLETWSFDGYLAAFRRGRRLSRREEIAEQMRLAARSS